MGGGASKQRVATLKGHTSWVNAVASYTTQAGAVRVVSGSYDNIIKIWDPDTQRLLATLQGHTNDVNTVACYTTRAGAVRVVSGSGGNLAVRDAGDSPDLTMLHDVDLNVTIELGRTRMFVEDVVQLGADSVIELDKAAGDPVDVFVNGRKVARGEVLVLNDNFCIRVSEILSAEPAPLGSAPGGVLPADRMNADGEESRAN